MKKASLFLTLCFIAAIAVSAYTAYACTRVVYKGPENKMIITARSMDWKDDIYPNIWVFPRGAERNGEVGKASAKWKSKYGSVVVSAFDIATTDGINEKGLVSNILWLEESIYPKFNANGKQKGMSLAIWAQYVLDNYATVDEAVKDLQKNPITIVTANTPGRTSLATVHLAISDSKGDSAIFEYIDEKLVIYHSPEYNVLTNSPTFDKQLAVNNYISFIPGNISLPGSGRSEDRFARASYYAKAVKQSDDPKVAVGAAFSIIRNCSVPYGVHIEGKPNLSSTKWRTVADQTNLVYYYEDPLSLTPLWIDLKTLDFSPETPVKKLDVSKSQQYIGLSNSYLNVSQPFTFMGV
ncbi:linear amide C-N hydrolase [Flavobacterium agricola]|uniref:Linear amide C-N hydrolase n=1 Tax=Flavobacterium agricola TaxID=2870839 RepID=A0ABY6LWZ1_9FLAO|nr:linear amide C-N hydrolase [Flavobacterium agricola]UYW00482.1 linear amide C-N hydrolase [Flavobacterium agricola]